MRKSLQNQYILCKNQILKTFSQCSMPKLKVVSSESSDYDVKMYDKK